MKRFLIIAFLTATLIPAIDARKIRTLRPRISAQTLMSPNSEVIDTIIPLPDEVILSGYDKPLRASRETLFITNNTALDIVALVVTIKYIDIKGRQLHKRSVRIETPIPAFETRKADFHSWDSQKSFYYLNSKSPRSSQAMAYDISQRVDTIFVTPHPVP